MKRSAILLVLCSVVTWSACGGGGSGTQKKALSHIKDRVFVSNNAFGTVSTATVFAGIQIIDAHLNQISAFNINTNSGPTNFVLSPDKKTSIIIDAVSGDVIPIDNTTENTLANSGSISIGGVTESVVLASDNKTGYAAVRNFNNATGTPLGAVQKFDYTTASITVTIPVPAVRWIALNHAGTRLLAMSDTSDSVTIVDVTQTTPTLTTVAGFSRPVAAFFSSDDNTAYIVNCGPECGGTQAGVTELLMGTGTLGRTVNVSSARVALLSANTLYVAGSPSGSGGTAQTVDVSAFTAGAPVTIGNGQKTVIKSAANKIWIGSVNCGGGGCLTLWDPASSSVTVDNPSAGQPSKGDVTGMDLITSTNRMFVAEGGELRVYNTNLVEEFTTMDIVGKAYDVEYAPQ